MTKRDFLKSNRQEIDSIIKRACGADYRPNDEERWDWVMNDEPLHLWAKRLGVRV